MSIQDHAIQIVNEMEMMMKKLRMQLDLKGMRQARHKFNWCKKHLQSVVQMFSIWSIIFREISKLIGWFRWMPLWHSTIYHNNGQRTGTEDEYKLQLLGVTVSTYAKFHNISLATCSIQPPSKIFCSMLALSSTSKCWNHSDKSSFIMTCSIFSKMLPINMPYLTHENEVWDFSFLLWIWNAMFHYTGTLLTCTNQSISSWLQMP